jgi:tRNA wybutosine-synthesizing protein 1
LMRFDDQHEKECTPEHQQKSSPGYNVEMNPMDQLNHQDPMMMRMTSTEASPCGILMKDQQESVNPGLCNSFHDANTTYTNERNHDPHPNGEKNEQVKVTTVDEDDMTYLEKRTSITILSSINNDQKNIGNRDVDDQQMIVCACKPSFGQSKTNSINDFINEDTSSCCRRRTTSSTISVAEVTTKSRDSSCESRGQPITRPYQQEEMIPRRGRRGVWEREDGESISMVSSQTDDRSPILILYGSTTGLAKRFAHGLARRVTELCYGSIVTPVPVSLAEYETEMFTDEQRMCVFIISTQAEGRPPTDAAWFYRWLSESVSDFRVDKTYLSRLKYAVFGVGNSLYEDYFNQVAKQVDRWLRQLSAERLCPLGEGDLDRDIDSMFHEWSETLLNVCVSKKGIPLPTLSPHLSGENKCVGRRGQKGMVEELSWLSPDAKENDREVMENDYGQDMKEEICPSQTESLTDDDLHGSGDEGLIDMEDLGKVMTITGNHLNLSENGRISTTATTILHGDGSMVEDGNHRMDVLAPPPEMVTPRIRDSLTKQGYRVIGSHSGVKMCRWTKAMLRGRGGCYKHSFYGIESHRCMETTPSLACANKCVFCWRHHTNPVGTKWKWKMDEPEVVFRGAVENHLQMIKQMKGVPGLRADRFQEALTIRHCALSLVGEPIMYPKINELVDLLHQNEISSFLVTNAQFPEQLAQLKPVTQLYLSIDASTRDSLKKIDRPLFRDFWERFLASIDVLSKKGQRTVFRLTLVKDYNVSDVDSYVELIRRGRPEFVETKGVTYCGSTTTSSNNGGGGDTSSLTLSNVPYHHEVIDFVRQLAERLPDYEIACEHAHSCSVLLAHRKFKIDGVWHTWIDYERFHELVRRGDPFTSLDYIEETPGWAIFGAIEQGFDPMDNRFYRKSKSVNNTHTNPGI